MTEPRLLWTGTDETNQFHDDERGRIYWSSERPLRVPEDAVEEYLEQDGWEEPPDEDAAERLPGRDSESVRDARAREQQQEQQEDVDVDEDDDQTGTNEVRAGPATEETDAELATGEARAEDTNGGTEAGSQQDAGEDFDAEAFVDNGWREVERQIQSGEFDEHLGVIEHAERNRDGQPREASVIGAIKDRRNAPMADTDEDNADEEVTADESDDGAE